MVNGHDIKRLITNATEAENLSLGYVKLYRSIIKKSWYKKSEHVHLFIHLLLKAAHSGFETWYNGYSMTLKPGQLITGRKKLSDETGINESKIERVLKFFETEQQIEQQKSSSSRLISIVNWKSYQQNEQQIEQRVNNKRTTNEQRVNTIQEGLIMEKKNKVNTAGFAEIQQKEIKNLSIQARVQEFSDSLSSHEETYGQKMIKAFYDFWSELNKGETKMRMELERTWNLKNRLERWNNNSFKAGELKVVDKKQMVM